MLVESHLYRPTKIEGNDQHPASLGGTDIFAQASILDMYDPDRSQNITYLGELSTWGEFMAGDARAVDRAERGERRGNSDFDAVRFHRRRLADQFAQIRSRYPEAKWHVYEPVNRDNVIAGAQMAFGQPVETIYKFDAADVIVSLDADFLYAGFPGITRYARDFAKRRNPDAGNMSRMYVIESTPSSTGAKADHHLPVRASGHRAICASFGWRLGRRWRDRRLKGDQQKISCRDC